MKKRILSTISILVLIVIIVGCDNISEEEKKTVSAEVESNKTHIVEDETTDIVETEEIILEDKTDVESIDNKGEYEEQKDIFVCKHIDRGDGTEINLINKESVYGPFILTESIDIYSNFLTYAGYTKPDIKVGGVGKLGDWVFIPFAQSSFLVKAEDFDRVAVLEERRKDDLSESYLESVTELIPKSVDNSTIPAQTGSDIGSSRETPTTPEAAVQIETPTVKATIYSEEEVIGIVENALRDAGFRKPEEDMTAEELAMFGPTAGMGWGIENISMTDPYTDAAGTVEGFRFAGWKFYYIESQGSSDGYVHLKLYSGS